MEPVFTLLLVVIAGGGIFVYCKRLRYDKLMRKYGDPSVVRKILSRQYWEGQTRDQLLDALGNPQEVDRKFLKSKTREIWKYKKTGKNRFKLRLTLENQIVVGWDQKKI